MPPERIKLSLSARGVLYVLVPAAVQLLCLFGLLVLLNEEDAVGKRDSDSKEIISRANWMCVLVSSAVAGRIAYLESGSSQAQNLCHDALAQLPADIKQLKDCVKDEPVLAGVLNKAEPFLNRLQNALKDSTDTPPHQQIAQIISIS